MFWLQKIFILQNFTNIFSDLKAEMKATATLQDHGCIQISLLNHFAFEGPKHDNEQYFQIPT